MKKLMLMVVATVIAGAIHAASIQWGAVNLYAADGTSKYTSNVELLAVLQGGDVSAATVVESVKASNGVVANHTVTWTAAVTGETYDFYYRLTSGDQNLISTKISGVASDVGSTTVAFGNQASYTQNASNWANVPEPTSALLLMLGVAGLALKRKRV